MTGVGLLLISAWGPETALQLSHSLVVWSNAWSNAAPAASCSVLMVKAWLISKLVSGAHYSFSGHTT